MCTRTHTLLYSTCRLRRLSTQRTRTPLLSDASRLEMSESDMDSLLKRARDSDCDWGQHLSIKEWAWFLDNAFCIFAVDPGFSFSRSRLVRIVGLYTNVVVMEVRGETIVLCHTCFKSLVLLTFSLCLNVVQLLVAALRCTTCRSNAHAQISWTHTNVHVGLTPNAGSCMIKWRDQWWGGEGKRGRGREGGRERGGEVSVCVL